MSLPALTKDRFRAYRDRLARRGEPRTVEFDRALRVEICHRARRGETVIDLDVLLAGVAARLEGEGKRPDQVITVFSRLVDPSAPRRRA